MSDLQQVAEWIGNLDNVVALAGAGISTESGIPDFRGPNGVWTKDPQTEALSTIGNYLSDPEVRRRSWELERSNLMNLDYPLRAKPNAGHFALAELNAMECLDFLVTQNIDGLHQAAGFPRDSLVEIHGNNRESVCVSCGIREPLQITLAREEADPPCLQCGGILKRGVVYFGEDLNWHDLKRSQWRSEQADVFLALGTSLEVYPVANLPGKAKFNGARLVIMNAEKTDQDHRADAVFREPLGEILPELVTLVKEL